MTISSASTRNVVQLSTGATSVVFDFDYLNVNNINVYFNGILKAKDTDYTITDKTVTFTSALTQNTVVSIISNEDYSRDTDFTEPEEFDAAKVNGQLDQLRLTINQVRDQAVLVGSADASTDVVSLLDKATQEAESFSIASENSALEAKGYRDEAQQWAEAAEQIAIPDNSIQTIKLVNNVITTDKIADGAIIPSKLNASSNYNVNILSAAADILKNNSSVLSISDIMQLQARLNPSGGSNITTNINGFAIPINNNYYYIYLQYYLANITANIGNLFVNQYNLKNIFNIFEIDPSDINFHGTFIMSEASLYTSVVLQIDNPADKTPLLTINSHNLTIGSIYSGVGNILFKGKIS